MAQQYDSVRLFLQYLVPRDKGPALAPFLTLLERNKAQLGLKDAQMSLTSLEEVFLTIAKQAELEAAAAEGATKRSIPLADGATLEVGALGGLRRLFSFLS